MAPRNDARRSFENESLSKCQCIEIEFKNPITRIQIEREAIPKRTRCRVALRSAHDNMLELNKHAYIVASVMW